MQFYKTEQISIFFGDQATSFVPQQFYDIPSESALREADEFRAVVTKMRLKHLMALKQVHSVAGKIFSNSEDFSCRPYSFEGDYLITSVAHAGLAIATADCLPIIIYDKAHHVVAAAHAGWRGSVAGIAIKVLEEMHNNFGTRPKDCQVIFGPAAGPCCYEVDTAFVQQIAPEYRMQTVTQRQGRYFFDNTLYNEIQLQNQGVRPNAFVRQHAVCTICDLRFCSFRRDQAKARRQMTIVALNSI